MILILLKGIRIANHEERCLYGTRLWFQNEYEACAPSHLLLPQCEESGACQAQGPATISKRTRLSASTHSCSSRRCSPRCRTRLAEAALPLAILWQDIWSACSGDDVLSEPILELAD